MAYTNLPHASTCLRFQSRPNSRETASRGRDHIARLTPTVLNKFWKVQNSMTRTDWTKIRPKTVELSFKSDHIARRDSTKLFCRVESLKWSHRPTRFNSTKQFCWVESRRTTWSKLKSAVHGPRIDQSTIWFVHELAAATMLKPSFTNVNWLS